jgi:hypothetical protein
MNDRRAMSAAGGVTESESMRMSMRLLQGCRDKGRLAGTPLARPATASAPRRAHTLGVAINLDPSRMKP